MRDSNGKDLDTFPSAMGVITRLACERAQQQGVEVDLLLRKAGLTRQQIDDPRARLPVKSQIQICRTCREGPRRRVSRISPRSEIRSSYGRVVLLRIGFV